MTIVAAHTSAVPEDQNLMRQHADRLVDNGYKIIPIIPRGKKPGLYSSSGGWINFRNWNTFNPSPDDVEEWKTWPDVGIGVVCGNVCAVDIDILDPDLNQAVAASIMADLGNTGAIRIGRAPKKSIVYQTDAPFSKLRLVLLNASAKANNSSPMAFTLTPASPTIGRSRVLSTYSSTIFQL
jgi:hypothetical protein